MSNETKHQTSIFGGILKFLGFIVLAIVVLIVGAYCYLRFALGVDIIDIKKKIDLINVKVDESKLISNPYQEQDASEGFAIIFNNEDIYKDNGEGYVFDETAFTNGSLVGNVTLTDKQFASIINVYLNHLYSDGENEDFAKYIKLKQIKFDNFVSEAGQTSVDISTIAMLDFSEMKKEMGKKEDFISSILTNLIPNSIYINCNFKVSINESNPEVVEVENNYIIINQLSKQQSSEILNFINNFMGGENNNFMGDTLTTTFSNMLFGSDSNVGVLDMINGFSYFTFESDGTNIYLSLKKV